MAKYRTTSVALIATDTPDYDRQLQVTVTGVNVDDDKDVATFTDEISEMIVPLISSKCLRYCWEDDIAFFTGEHVEVELPNGEKATVFCCCEIDEDTGVKSYRMGHSPTERMYQLWMQLQTEASQAQPATHADTTNRQYLYCSSQYLACDRLYNAAFIS